MGLHQVSGPLLEDLVGFPEGLAGLSELTVLIRKDLLAQSFQSL